MAESVPEGKCMSLDKISCGVISVQFFPWATRKMISNDDIDCKHGKIWVRCIARRGRGRPYLDLAKRLHERLCKGIIQRIWHEEHYGEHREEGGGLDEDGDDGDVVRDMLLAHDAHDLASEEEEAGGDEEGHSDVQGKGQGEVRQGNVCHSSTPWRRRRGCFDKHNSGS